MADIPVELGLLLGEMQGKLTTLIEQSAKESRERGEKVDVRFDRVEREQKGTNARLDAAARALTQLEGRVGDVERQAAAAKEAARKSSEDLSNHIASDDDTNKAMMDHMARIDTRLGTIQRTSGTQTADVAIVKSQTEAQTPILERVDKRTRFGPVALLAGAFFGSAGAHFVVELWKILHS